MVKTGPGKDLKIEIRVMRVLNTVFVPEVYVVLFIVTQINCLILT